MAYTRRTGRAKLEAVQSGVPVGASPELIAALRAISPDLTEPDIGDVFARIRWFKMLCEHGACEPGCERCAGQAIAERIFVERGARELAFMREHDVYGNPRPRVEHPAEHAWSEPRGGWDAYIARFNRPLTAPLDEELIDDDEEDLDD